MARHGECRRALATRQHRRRAGCLSGPACAEPVRRTRSVDRSRKAQLEPMKWSELEGWAADDHLAAFTTFQVSCQPFRKVTAADGGDRSTALCGRSAAGPLPRPANAEAARAFFEDNFRPVRISASARRRAS